MQPWALYLFAIASCNVMVCITLLHLWPQSQVYKFIRQHCGMKGMHTVCLQSIDIIQAYMFPHRGRNKGP
jgi:hypothetical protein